MTNHKVAVFGLRLFYIFKHKEIICFYIFNCKNQLFICSFKYKSYFCKTFFYSQLIVKNQARHPKQGDFLIDDKYLFEVGGKNKTFEQIADLPNSFLAVDDTEVGHGNRIPLWMFGLLY